MGAHKIKSYAKLNLALNVIGKNSLLHKIETIIVFVSLHDEIIIEKINSSWRVGFGQSRGRKRYVPSR